MPADDMKPDLAAGPTDWAFVGENPVPPENAPEIALATPYSVSSSLPDSLDEAIASLNALLQYLADSGRIRIDPGS